MGRTSTRRWAALAVAVAACGLTTQSGFAAVQPATGAAMAAAECPIWFWWCWHEHSPSPIPSASVAPAAAAVPTPTATPGAAPSATPTAAPSTPPTGTPTPAPSASAPALPSPIPTAASSPSATPRPAPTRASLPAPGQSVAVLSSDAIQITGLRSLAVRSVTTAAGAVKVIELQAAGSTITGLGLRGPCVGHARVDTSAARDVATGGLTLDATALQATILGIPITIAAADLPEGALTLPGISLPALPTDLGFLTVQLFVLSIQSGTMALQAPKITPSGC
jgi:hypothetical protein